MPFLKKSFSGLLFEFLNSIQLFNAISFPQWAALPPIINIIWKEAMTCFLIPFKLDFVVPEAPLPSITIPRISPNQRVHSGSQVAQL